MLRSQVVIRLANLASTGKYEVTPAEAKAITNLYNEVAEVINELEHEEDENNQLQAQAEGNDDGS